MGGIGSGRKKQTVVDRCSLSPFPVSAISQLLPEVIANAHNKIEALKELRRVKAVVQAVITRVDEQPWRKKKKRKWNAKATAQRAAWMAQRRAGTERYKADATQPVEDEGPELTLAEYEDSIRQPVLPGPKPVPVKTREQIAREMNQATSDRIELEKAALRGERWAIEQLEEE